MNRVPLQAVLASLESGGRPPGGASADSGEIPSIGGEHLDSEGGFDFTSLKRIPRTFFDTMRAGRIAARDILIVKDGATTGKTSFIGAGFPYREAAVNEHVFCARVDQSRAYPEYVFHFLRSPDGQKAIAQDFHGATVGGISRDFARKVEIPLPSISDQRRIAEILGKSSALRAKRCAAFAQLDALSQSIFLDMFGDAATNPKGWNIATLADVSEVQGGLQLSPSRESLPHEVPYLRVANVHRGRLELHQIKTLRATEREIARTALIINDFLIVEGHGNPDEIGRGALWDGSISPCVHQNHLIRVRLDDTLIEPVYSSFYLNSAGGRRHLLRSGKTTSGLNTINVSQVRATPIAVPPIEHQRMFCNHVSRIERVRASCVFALSKMDLLFESLQCRAFRGEL